MQKTPSNRYLIPPPSDEAAHPPLGLSLVRAPLPSPHPTTGAIAGAPALLRSFPHAVDEDLPTVCTSISHLRWPWSLAGGAPPHVHARGDRRYLACGRGQGDRRRPALRSLPRRLAGPCLWPWQRRPKAPRLAAKPEAPEVGGAPRPCQRGAEAPCLAVHTAICSTLFPHAI